MPFDFDSQRRMNYFTGQFLQEEDFLQQQAYHVDRLRLHQRGFHVPGVVAGELGVTANVGENQVTVATGTAIDPAGRLIYLKDARVVSWGPAERPNQTAVVVISYDEVQDTSAGGGQNMRILERPKIVLVKEADLADKNLIPLMKLTLDANSKITASDKSVVVTAGARVGDDLEVARLRLRATGVGSGSWPLLQSNAANQANLTGNLAVSGQLTAGSFAGKLISKANLKLTPVLAGDTTTAQLDGPALAGGILNPGGTAIYLAKGNVPLSTQSLYFGLVTSVDALKAIVRAEIVYSRQGTDAAGNASVCLLLRNEGSVATKAGWQVLTLAD